MIGFEWPWAFALIGAPFLARWVLPTAQVTNALELPIGGELRNLAAQEPESIGRIVPLALLAWSFLVLAGAQPTWTGDPVPLAVHARDLLLAVDVSGSMSEKDIDKDIGYGQRDLSRLEAVQDIAGDFIERREGDRIGLILFGTCAYLYAPLSLDRKTVALLLSESEVGLAGESTAIGDAIVVGIKQLRESASRARVLILLTDGENTAGSIPPTQAAELAAAEGIRIHTIGFGSESPRSVALQMLGLQGPQVEEEPLKQIAKQTGGRFFRARDTGELEEIYELLDRIEPVEAGARTFRPTRSLFHWPLGVALALVAIIMLRRGVLW
jgi:Ca-activated chloride channel family protein